MTAIESRPAAAPVQAGPAALPLLPEDPPRVGDFWLRARIAVTPAGYVYAGQTDAGVHAVVVMMTEGSADDAAARDRFQVAVDRLPVEVLVARNSTDDDDLALWAAIGPVTMADGSSSAADSRQIAERHGHDVLSAVLMDRVPQIGRVRGPDYRHHWENRRRPGLFRLWPLPWPTSLRAASRLALTLSLLTMMLLMLVALLIAWLLFRNQPEVDPGPVVPTAPGTRTVTITPTTPPPPSSGPPSTGTTTMPTPTSGGTSPVPSPSPGGTEGTIPTNLPSGTGSPVNPEDRY
jgi:hypothetical protein